MAETDIGKSVASIEDFVKATIEKAREISEREAAAAEAFAKEWEDLYASVPEGRLRAFQEIAGIFAARNSAKDRGAQTAAELQRFNAPAAPRPLPLP